jgi:UDP-glucuronate 4-epimerase
VIDVDVQQNAFFSTPLFSELVQITHVMHLAAQPAVRYAMENPGSYVRSNIAQLVNMYL